MNAREQKRRARIEALLDTAMELVVDLGLDGLTIAGLADRAQVSVGGLYRYFPSKQHLLVALQHRAIDDYHQALLATLATAEPKLAARPPADAALARLRAAFSAYLDHASTSPIAHQLVTALLAAPGPILTDAQATAVDAALTPIVQTYTQLFYAAADAGALTPGDARQRTHMLWAALHGLDQMRKRDRILPPNLRVPALLDRLLTDLFAGWAA